jgi:hypothetical protein
MAWSVTSFSSKPASRDLLELIGFLERLIAGRRVVFEEPGNALQFRPRDECIFAFLKRNFRFTLIGERGDDGEEVTFDFAFHGIEGVWLVAVEVDCAIASHEHVDHALAAIFGVVLFKSTDGDEHLPAVREGFAKDFAAGTAGSVVVHTDVDEPIGGGSVGIVSDRGHFLAETVDPVNLVVGIERTDGDAANAGGNCVFDFLLLNHGRCFRGHDHLDFESEFLRSGNAAGFGDLPEVCDLIGDEGDGWAAFVWSCVGGRGVGSSRGSGGFGRGILNLATDQQKSR